MAKMNLYPGPESDLWGLLHGLATRNGHGQHADEMLKTARTRQHRVGCVVPATFALVVATLAMTISPQHCVYDLLAATGHGGRANVACAPTGGSVGSSADYLHAPMQLPVLPSWRNSGLMC